jgi:hypothetical protein
MASRNEKDDWLRGPGVNIPAGGDEPAQSDSGSSVA